MAYIAPNTDIIILRGCPLDKSYQHTWYFEDADQQYNYFESLKKYVFDAQSYQRYDRGVLRIKTTADNLYDCNYLMFRNTAYGAKWFYAFIDRVEYIANMVTEVYYTLDVMQTWYFDYQLENCFVEREHTSTDGVGDNLVPENLDTGELIISDVNYFTFPDDTNPSGPQFSAVLLYTVNEKAIGEIVYYTEGELAGQIREVTWVDIPQPATLSSGATGSLYNGIYMGVRYITTPMGNTPYDASDTRANFIIAYNISYLVKSIETNGASLVRIMQVPHMIVEHWINNPANPSIFSKTFFQPTTFLNTNHDLGGYTPVNKKMYTFPYMTLSMSDNAGNSSTYRWEWFKTRGENGLCYADFEVEGVPVITPEVMCYPTQYKGMNVNYEEGIILTDFPFPAWTADTFLQWWQQNSPVWRASLISSSISAAGKMVSVGMTKKANAVDALGAVAGVSGLVGNLAQMESMQATPNQLAGQANASSLRIVQNRVGFTFYSMTCQPDIAESIDNFFTMFGYAVKKVKTPNLFGGGALRPYFNFLQTKACVIHPRAGTGLPAEDENTISQIYDRGITFWNTAGTIGDYSLNNAPV